jgi:hypothetical protein
MPSPIKKMIRLGVFFLLGLGSAKDKKGAKSSKQ